jgi:hypothetical protein
MADLIGFSNSVVKAALKKVQSVIEEEAELRQSKRGLVFITGEIQMMQSFLNVTDEEHVGNIVVRAWVRQIRELAYDAEECIDYFVAQQQPAPRTAFLREVNLKTAIKEMKLLSRPNFLARSIDFV